MILDSIKNIADYSSIHPNLLKGVEFVKQNAATIPVGKYILDSDNLYVMIVETDLRDAESAYLEAHREYIDVQVVIDGNETFAWSAIDSCTSVKDEYDAQSDIMFFNDRPSTLINAVSGQFLVFFPEDAHAPLIGKGKIRKAIIKAKVK